MCKREYFKNYKKSIMKKNFFITFKIGRNTYRKFYHDEIIFIKADRAYCIIKTSTQTFIVTNMSLNKFVKEIQLPNFLRINRSYIINLNKCVEYKYGSSASLVLSCSTIIKPITMNVDIINQ